MKNITVLALENPGADHLRVLKKLPGSANVVVGDQMDGLQEAAAKADVILTGMSRGSLLRTIFPKATQARWVHALSAGVENILFPELIRSPVTLTNGRGVFKRSLAEFVIAAALFFIKDLRRLVRNQEAGVWEQFDVEEIHGKVMGIVGYGETGKAIAERARAFGMKVLGLRRRPELSRGDSLLDEIFGPDRLQEMLAECDFIVLAAPSTPATERMIGEAEIAFMKAEAVLINVGRGSLVDEAALVRALEQNRIRGAALDVFEVEPLPPGHPFYRLRNVLLSPHSADHTPGWRELAMEYFVQNFERFRKGEPLGNIVDKTAGY